MSASHEHLDDPSRIGEIRELIRTKAALRQFYDEVYSKYREVLARCPKEGLAVELGSGGGFAKDAVPGIVTSDTIAYEGVDRVVDATQMPFADGELRALFLMNVFHHIPDVGAFLHEAERCLAPGGRIYMFDQYPGWISTPILKHAHHEPFTPDAEEWTFASSGPLSGANGALAWMVFERDLQKFEERFSKLRLARFSPCAPLRYWIAGGLKAWSLLPGWAFGAATALDASLVALTPKLGSFVDIEIERAR